MSTITAPTDRFTFGHSLSILVPRKVYLRAPPGATGAALHFSAPRAVVSLRLKRPAPRDGWPAFVRSAAEGLWISPRLQAGHRHATGAGDDFWRRFRR